MVVVRPLRVVSDNGRSAERVKSFTSSMLPETR